MGRLTRVPEFDGELERLRGRMAEALALDAAGESPKAHIPGPQPAFAVWCDSEALEARQEFGAFQVVQPPSPPPKWAQDDYPRGWGQVTYVFADGPAMKIGGTTAGRLRKRHIELQIGNPRDIMLAAVIDGDVEAELHARLDPLRIRGEWFHITAASVAVVRAAAKARPAMSADRLFSYMEILGELAVA